MQNLTMAIRAARVRLTDDQQCKYGAYYADAEADDVIE
jgi:hypothetical protein